MFALPSKAADSKGLQTPMYQFTFDAGGHSFSRVFTEEGLVEFLAEELSLTPEVLDNALDELHASSKTTITEIEISANEAAAMGLKEAGVDY
jgi:hypothetical protein